MSEHTQMIRMIFVGAGKWDGPVSSFEDEWLAPPAQLQARREDVFPFAVPNGVVPLVVGQELLLPDQADEPWRVARVLHNHGRGLHSPPTTWVVLVRG